MILPHTYKEKSSFYTQDRHGYNVQFSPTDSNTLAVATSQCFGSVGGGTVFLLKVNENGAINKVKSFNWTDGFFDIAWSRHITNMLISACGDSNILLWDVDSNANAVTSIFSGYSKPKSYYCEHSKEVCCVDWNHLSEDSLFLSSSWDCSIKLWNPDYAMSLKTYNSHTKLVYESRFAKKIPNIFMSVSADGYLKIWDVLQPQPVSSILAHQKSEILSCDWSEFDQNVIATGASDGQIGVWDLRYIAHPLFELCGCEYAVRRVRFSPFESNILASVSYDHTTRIWDWQHDCNALETLTHHSEFNYGLDWNRLVRNQLADCGWDSIVNVYVPKSLN